MARKRDGRLSARSYSMPELSELYGEPPFHYREVGMLLVEFETEQALLRELVPKPLTPNRDGTMFLSVAEFLCSGFGHYYEMHLFTHATYQRRLVNFSLYLILDNDVAICGGREIWGFPKKLGRLTMDMTDDVVSATVERGGIQVVDCAMRMATMIEPEALGGTAEWVARKFVPNVKQGARPDVDQLTSTTLTDIEVAEVHKGPGTLSFAASPADRLHEVPVVRVRDGYYYESRFTLGDGIVLHDYLA
ncbi:MAG: acetoacetate decarboxylase family protein [Gammaproteobacteria bacterium]